jgi:metal-sulfur cluster biosynthetic enzyme
MLAYDTESRTTPMRRSWLFWLVQCGFLLQQAAAQQPSPRSDSMETKIKLLQAAWERKDFDLARSLSDTLRDTVIQTQHEQQPTLPSLIQADQFVSIDSLDRNWQEWAKGWRYLKSFTLTEPIGIQRIKEPVEIGLSFPSEQLVSLSRELRIAKLSNGKLIEVPSQVFSELRRDDQRYCKILILADSVPGQTQTYFVLYGNPDAELPHYPTDLTTQGSGYGLDISNAHFTASLSRQTGQLERLKLRREHGLELYAGGEGHGEPPGIDWAHDYVDEGGFQKMRISLWEKCPDYEVIQGPLCTIVRRWGFPHSPIHPIFTPSRLHVNVEYRFYSSQPWFHKIGAMKAVQDFSAEALRDDEWVFSGQPFTDQLWMTSDGKLRVGEVDADQQEKLWGVGFFNQQSKDSFIALFLDHSAEGIPELKHTGAPLMYYRWHGHVWSRYPLPLKHVPAGAVIRQKNAYVSIPFTSGQSQADIESLRKSMMNPLIAASIQLPEALRMDRPTRSTGQLARLGEAGDAMIDKRLIWDALQDCKDAQLYKADISVVELGLVYDLRVQGDVVTLVMATPHKGRPRLGYFIDGSISVHPTLSIPIRERLLKVPGVSQVVFEHAEYPAWNSNRLTDEGRKKLSINKENAK